MATQIETLAAILSSSTRAPLQALITNTYAMLGSDKSFSSLSVSTLEANDGVGAYVDTQQSSFSGFSFDLADIVVIQNQSPDTLLSNMTTDDCSVSIVTINQVVQDQAPDTLLSNMLTSDCDVTIVTINSVDQDQTPDTLLSNMTTSTCSVIIT